MKFLFYKIKIIYKLTQDYEISKRYSTKQRKFIESF